ncbi:ferritin-like domain-containing protein [Scenedesmus sp. NREL 46B-D3]|nr:ferritin-like domain-containing protein [Scenedesmus sp. NREL 46B-D3]
MHLQRSLLVLAAAMLLATHVQFVSGEGLPVQYGLLGLGDLTTTDQGGPYRVPAVQAFEVEAALAAKTGAPGGPFFDRDVLNFLANTECLEATFNTYAAFGEGLPSTLTPGEVVGGQRANLSTEVQAWAEEVALDEQGHVRMVREVLGPNNSVPCPKLDLIGGFRAFFDNAVNKSSEPSFDPYANDINFLLATWSLEEIGSTGDKGCILLVSNPGVANAISGLATSASYQSGVDRHFLWQRRNETVPEYNMTVQEIVLAISNYRDELDGPPETDQALLNGNPNFIAVPTRNINLVPTDIRGLTFSRTPQQVLRIVTLGGDGDKGGFFPDGVNGKINSTEGYTDAANAYGGYPGNEVKVVSLTEADRASLLNDNITNVTPAKPEVQATASGQQYVQGGSPSPSSPSPSSFPATTTTESAPATTNTDSDSDSQATAGGAGAVWAAMV